MSHKITVQKEWGERDRSCAVGEREAKKGEVNEEITYKSYSGTSNIRIIFIPYEAYLFDILKLFD